jgi:undecaprenyl diphosphate synthase
MSKKLTKLWQPKKKKSPAFKDCKMAIQGIKMAADALHVAIIMDGNGRWAHARGQPRGFGHKAGMDAVRRTLEAARDLPIACLTLYSFSEENWRRPPEEIEDLMGLLRLYLKKELAAFHEQGVRLRVIGDRSKLPVDIVELIAHAEKLTEHNRGLTLQLALSYGGRQEILYATKKIAEEAAAGQISPAALDEKVFADRLYTAGIKDPDLIIRTSGEKRISNFLLWQAAYAEFVFLDVLWPDFDRTHLQASLDEYQRRERRFGAAVG